ncbi:tyrosine-type recombinase/integrase [Pectobacterium aroidearum]|uniref:tyrosine-type recombinase/integrase n=1 Tax=Pectobacterium aroidearum TaxID=1201031 RepID=UPI002114AB1B|nr:site-specific integrase [Pectobacterium aroidearum]UUE37927.1 tyrosine-type recombinase/integrase [Pectobacterium aroidearum]UUE42302.1 tyrosine-type recombinase/integrase [Pectobacterium aroidearum]
MLTDTKLRKALGKKRDSVEIISDSHGLNARISKNGKVSFFYRYRWMDNPVQMNIGEYPSMTIAQARERRQVLRSWITDGYDPREKVRLERASRSEALTVSGAFHYWIDKYCIPNDIKRADYYIKIFNKHIHQSLGDIKIDNTDRMHWLDVLDRMESPVMANVMTSICKRAFKFCSNRGAIKANPLENINPKDVGSPSRRRDRKLSEKEIIQIWRFLDEKMSTEPRFILKFIILTGCRTAEIRLSKWSWFDFDDSTWTVPIDSYKTGVSVRRFLPPEAKAMLLERRNTVKTKHVVTSNRISKTQDFDRPIQAAVASNYAKSIVKKSGMSAWSPHDIRRTIATKLSEMGCPPHVIEKILGHQMTGVMAHYNLHDYMDEQRYWLGVWEEYIMKVVGR